MRFRLEQKSIDRLIPKKVPQQTAFWGNLKRDMGYETLAFDIYVNTQKKKYHYDFLMIIVPIADNKFMAYIPFAANMFPDNIDYGKSIEAFSEKLRNYLPKKCIFIRHELNWEIPWAYDPSYYDSENNWLGRPEVRLMEMRMNFSTEYWNLRKAPTDILPPDTVFVYLNDSDNKILRKMKQKTRYNINLSKRKGVKIKTADYNSLDTWYKLYYETSKRNKIQLHDKRFFGKVLRSARKDSASEVRLLFAEAEREPLSAMFLLLTPDRATYLYGASASEKRNYMASYALQWEAMKIGKSYSCSWYDMFGVAPTPDTNHPMYGLYRFKTGFGGQLFHRYGCWDYPINKDIYEKYRMHELQDTGFHI